MSNSGAGGAGRILTIVVLLAIGAGFVVENYILKGSPILDGTITVNEINPRPTLVVQVREGVSSIRVYIRSTGDDDYTLNYAVIDPDGEVLIEGSDEVGRTDFAVDVGEPGNYGVQVSTESDRAGLSINVWANDRRLLSGCM